MEKNAAATFSAFYESTLLPDLQELEKHRKKFVKDIIRYILYFLSTAAVLFASGFFRIWPDLAEILMVVAAIIALAGLIVGMVKYHNFNKSYTPDFKDKIIRQLIHYIDDQLDYQPTKCIPQHQYAKSNIFIQKPDRYKGEDFICGKVGETQISFSELHAEYKTTTTDKKGRKQTHWHTIFKGIFFEADFNKEFKTRTYVLPDTMEKTFGFLGKKLQSMNFARPPLVKLEDPEFERHFVVYGEDQVEARYILSPGLMQRLMDFRNKSNKSVSLSFVENSIYVAIPESKNLFEPRLFRSNLDPGFIREYYDFLELTIGIVEDLNLNLRIWTKTPA